MFGFVSKISKDNIAVVDSNGNLYWASMCGFYQSFVQWDKVWVVYTGFDRKVVRIFRKEYAESTADLLRKYRSV